MENINELREWFNMAANNLHFREQQEGETFDTRKLDSTDPSLLSWGQFWIGFVEVNIYVINFNVLFSIGLSLLLFFFVWHIEQRIHKVYLIDCLLDTYIGLVGHERSDGQIRRMHYTDSTPLVFIDQLFICKEKYLLIFQQTWL